MQDNAVGGMRHAAYRLQVAGCSGARACVAELVGLQSSCRGPDVERKRRGVRTERCGQSDCAQRGAAVAAFYGTRLVSWSL